MMAGAKTGCGPPERERAAVSERPPIPSRTSELNPMRGVSETRPHVPQTRLRREEGHGPPLPMEAGLWAPKM